MGDHDQAERLLKSYIAKAPDSREARLLLGATFAKEGRFPEAADEFIALLARDPRDIEALNNVAVIYRRQGKYQEALDYLKTAIEIDPTRADFHYNIGNMHKQLGNSKAASLAYAKVIELDPGYVQAYNNLGTIYDQLKEYDKAYGMFRKGLALDQNNPKLHFNYGVSLEANGRLEDAAEEYRVALRSKPGWFLPMNNLGIVSFKQGHHDKAISAFNQVLNADPFNAEAYNNIGVVLADQGRTKEAIKNYRRAIEADSRYTKAVINLERALESTGNFSDALLELEKLVKLSPDSTDARERLAGLYLKMERYPEALEQAEAALEWDPDSIQALRIKGAVLRVMGNDQEAQTCFERILSMDSGNYAFLLDLADIHFRRKEYKEAEERIQAYLLRRPNDREAKLLLGRLYAEMGNRTHAIQVFEELSKSDPSDTEALAAAAELHKKAGSVEKALRAADELVNLQGKRATADDLTELNKSLELYENAVNAYSTSVREMWDRNIKLMAGGEAEKPREEDVSLLMGAAGVSLAIEEESESLFTEGLETFFGEEEERDLVLDEDSEEAAAPRYKDPLDALAEPARAEPEQQVQYGKDTPYGVASKPVEPEVPPYQAPVLPSSPLPPKPAPEAVLPPQQEKIPDEPPPPEPESAVLDSAEAIVLLEDEMPVPAAETAESDSVSEVFDSHQEPSNLQFSAGAESRVVSQEDQNVSDIPAVIALLVYLKHLTDELPMEERKSYIDGWFPAALESVIDSLKKLTIIKERAFSSNNCSPHDNGEGDGSRSG